MPGLTPSPRGSPSTNPRGASGCRGIFSVSFGFEKEKGGSLIPVPRKTGEPPTAGPIVSGAAASSMGEESLVLRSFLYLGFASVAEQVEIEANRSRLFAAQLSEAAIH